MSVIVRVLSVGVPCGSRLYEFLPPNRADFVWATLPWLRFAVC